MHVRVWNPARAARSRCGRRDCEAITQIYMDAPSMTAGSLRRILAASASFWLPLRALRPLLPPLLPPLPPLPPQPCVLPCVLPHWNDSSSYAEGVMVRGVACGTPPRPDRGRTALCEHWATAPHGSLERSPPRAPTDAPDAAAEGEGSSFRGARRMTVGPFVQMLQKLLGVHHSHSIPQRPPHLPPQRIPPRPPRPLRTPNSRKTSSPGLS